MFALLHCWYEGDSNLVDDSLVAVSESAEDLENVAEAVYARRINNESRRSFVLYKLGEAVPDDKGYGDLRFRIVELVLGAEHPNVWVMPDRELDPDD